jgi:sulfite reductase (NADPH) flavoprotein alpha-component
VDIPCLPESAPFTLEQRAYLNGFLAGLFSRAPAQVSPVQGAKQESLLPLTILFGSQTGNCENLAKRIAKEAGKRGFAPTVHEMTRYPVAQLPSEERLLIVASTYGDGEPPDNAKAFWEFLSGDSAPRLERALFSVCALGDSNYARFCGFGREVDARLEILGGRRARPRVDCDVEYEEAFAQWLDDALASMGKALPDREPEASCSAGVLDCGLRHRPGAGGERHGSETLPELAAGTAALRGAQNRYPMAEGGYSRSNPYPAELLVNRLLNAPGSAKETRHFEMSLGIDYQAGDALGVLPENCPQLVEELLGCLGFSGGEAVPGHEQPVPVRDAFLHHYEITRIPSPLLRVMAERTGDSILQKLSSPEGADELNRFLRGREIIDLLLQHPQVRFQPIEFVGLLKKLQPRLYSISSSPAAHKRQVHLTVNTVRYESHGRRRKGVCSTFLADRLPPGAPVRVFVHSNKQFRLPASGDTPVIMVGPGTGIAPFRAFLHERAAAGAKGRNWLFYGDQRRETDFMYGDELESWMRSGTLTRLDTAFSRDQAEKVYVQDRMRECGQQLFAWLEEGASFYVCGDASRMAKDVDAALHEILQTAGGFNADRAADYVSRMKSEKRYLRDVY